MSNQSQLPMIRRLLFPYSGEEPLTTQQTLRVVAVWGLFFAVVLTLCTLPFVVGMARSADLNRMLLIILLAFSTALVLFGFFGWFVVFINNRAARILQERKKMKASSGGTYGS